jgi:hypothetical protein
MAMTIAGCAGPNPLPPTRDADSEETEMAIKTVALASRWMSVTDVVERLRRARENCDQHAELLTTLEGQVAQRRSDVERSLADLPPAQKFQVLNRAANGYRSELKRQTADARLALVREAGKLREEVSVARDHYQSAVQMLMREGLGSERRSRLLQQIEKSGPTELASLAALAAATADQELGAALCTRISGLPPAERPFSSKELAEALVGAEHRRVTQSIVELERLALETVSADTAVEAGKENPGRNMQVALMRRAEAAIGADLSDADQVVERRGE